MRKLQTKDVFRLSRAITKANIKERVIKIMKEKYSGEKVSDEEVGIDTILTLIELFSEKDQEKIIYDFFGDIFECTGKELECMELDLLIGNAEQLCKENNLISFFKRARQLSLK